MKPSPTALAFSSTSSSGHCTPAGYEAVLRELEVRDFLNRLPEKYKLDPTTLASKVSTLVRKEDIDWESLSSALQRLRPYIKSVPNHFNLPNNFEARASDLLEAAIDATTERNAQNLKSALRNARLYLEDIGGELRGSLLEGSSDIAAGIEEIQSNLDNMEDLYISESTAQVDLPMRNFEAEILQLTNYPSDFEDLAERARSASRALDGCDEEELFQIVFAEQSKIMRIHDEDDRRLVPASEELSVTALPLSEQPGFARLSEAHVAAVGVLVLSSRVTSSDQGTTLETHPYKDTRKLCDGEAFENAVASPAPVCTAFVVHSGGGHRGALIATARHCLEKLQPATATFVLNYRGHPAGPFPGLRALSIKNAVSAQGTFPADDWAIIELAQPLPTVTPLPMRRQGSIDLYDPLFILGYPDGLPLVVASSARVEGFGKSSEAPFLFEANIDTLGGNSGSPVFNLRSGTVEGILSRADPRRPFVSRAGCYRILPCDGLAKSCRWEKVTRITSIASALENLISSEGVQ